MSQAAAAPHAPAHHGPLTVTGPAIASRVVEAIRARRPLVHCITNEVTIGRVADALAALGALPVMASAPEEAADMVEHAQALVLNLGTPSVSRWQAARASGERAAVRGIPVLLDPVGCGATPWRTDQARELVGVVPITLVRGNAPEVAALAKVPLPQSLVLRGVTAVQAGAADSRSGPASGMEVLATQASRALRAAMLVTGRQNVLADGDRVTTHTTGVSALERVVGGGDVLTALCAACLAVERDAFTAALAGLALFSSAARGAAARAGGPGTFWPALLDELAGPTPETPGGDDALG